MIDFTLYGLVGKPQNGATSCREKVLEVMKLLRKTRKCEGRVLPDKFNTLEDKHFTSHGPVTRVVRCPNNPKTE